MNDRVVFDASTQSFEWPILGALVVLGLLAVVAVRTGRIVAIQREVWTTLATIVASLIVFLWWLIRAADLWTLRARLRDGSCSVVEGYVTEFRPASRDGHGGESFIVSGRYFSYADYRMSAGFHQTSIRGGPIREGMRVRIHHLRGEIARLEISRPPDNNPLK